MDAADFECLPQAKPSRFARSPWLPIILSFSLHGLLLIPLFVFSTEGPESGDQNILLDAVVIDEGVTLYVLPSDSPNSRSSLAEPNARSHEVEIEVKWPPLERETDPPASPGPAPIASSGIPRSTPTQPTGPQAGSDGGPGVTST